MAVKEIGFGCEQRGCRQWELVYMGLQLLWKIWRNRLSVKATFEIAGEGCAQRAC